MLRYQIEILNLKINFNHEDDMGGNNSQEKSTNIQKEENI